MARAKKLVAPTFVSQKDCGTFRVMRKLGVLPEPNNEGTSRGVSKDETPRLYLPASDLPHSSNGAEAVFTSNGDRLTQEDTCS
jgi:hypothetical protein